MQNWPKVMQPSVQLCTVNGTRQPSSMWQWIKPFWSLLKEKKKKKPEKKQPMFLVSQCILLSSTCFGDTSCFIIATYHRSWINTLINTFYFIVYMNTYFYTNNFHKLKDIFKAMIGNHLYKLMGKHWAAGYSTQSPNSIFIMQSSE